MVPLPFFADPLHLAIEISLVLLSASAALLLWSIQRRFVKGDPLRRFFFLIFISGVLFFLHSVLHMSSEILEDLFHDAGALRLALALLPYIDNLAWIAAIVVLTWNAYLFAKDFTF